MKSAQKPSQVPAATYWPVAPVRGHSIRRSWNSLKMIEQTSSEVQKMSDLDDLNRTLYDIGAHDLLEDVWEAMETEAGRTDGTSPGCWTSAAAAFGRSSNTPVLKDRLLTDSVLHGEEFPVNTEHSYSLGGSSNSSCFGAGSDGDSMPESPLSLDDDMETECYPCIPMQSASNQKRMQHTTVTVIKQEPFSPEDINVVVDDDDSLSNSNVVTKAHHQQQVGSSFVQVKKAKRKVNSVRMHQQTVRLTRPKHPQSLLKQKPVTILVTTTPAGVPTSSTSLTAAHNKSAATSVTTAGKLLSSVSSSFDASSRLHNSSTTTIKSEPLDIAPLSPSSGKSAAIHTSLISSQPTDGCGVLVLTEEEKKTLISEGYPIPSKLPLTKAEEKSLKKIRRKIKNKISAQESRRKKKEFVDTLERRVELAVQELDGYKKKCEQLQKHNTSLQSQLKSLRAIVASSNATQVFPLKLDPDGMESMLSGDLDLD